MNQQLALIQNTDTPEVTATDYAPKEVAFVKPFEQQLALIEGEFSKFVFDYANPDDNEKARSLIRKLQKSRAAIERVGKAERDPAILYQRHVIEEEKKLTVRVQKLIDQYEKPLKEWEAQDKLRQDEIKARIAQLRPAAEWVLTASASSLKAHLSLVEATDPDVGFAEFSAEAFAARITTIDYLKEHVGIAEKREADAARLAQLEAEAEARRVADEAAAEAKRLADAAEAQRIADEAAEQERQKEAAAQAKRDRVAAEAAAAAEAKRIEEAAEAARLVEAKKAQDAIDEANRQKQKAIDDAAAAAAESKRREEAAEAQRIADAAEAQRRQDAAVAAEAKRIADEAAAQKAISDARAADNAHRAKVNNEVLDALMGLNGDISDAISNVQAKAIIVAIALGKIPHLKITY